MIWNFSLILIVFSSLYAVDGTRIKSKQPLSLFQVGDIKNPLSLHLEYIFQSVRRLYVATLQPDYN